MDSKIEKAKRADSTNSLKSKKENGKKAGSKKEVNLE